MGLLSRLRAWLGGSSAESDDDDTIDEGESAATDSDAESDEATRLDPDAATETRTTATDDAVDALRDVRRQEPDPNETDSAGPETDDE
ncbi:hypothetical protein [Halorubrum sp. PV6]|uniref:hypothetical protein n=1 Tax=Halorubrum sp. PV6 TaxID=634157 RepID=UPI000F84E8C2|nr:hypothetical protein [Halorubrum sp. PV6]AZQ15165.1 hypothetical protein DOS48_10205 [Halorubrum sp. PV6]